jgi:uncharacterized repeat protein (TIGR03803 family)
VQGTDGNFYGTTSHGGNENGAGAVFKLTPQGTLTTLYSLCGQIACKDGSTPRGGLALGSDGNFYGTTSLGGKFGYGTVFKITPSGVLTRLHSFSGIDGYYPKGGLSQSTNGAFYGTTYYGGTLGFGTIYRLSVEPE